MKRKATGSTASIATHVRGLLLLVTGAARPTFRTIVPDVLGVVDRTHPSGTVGPVAPLASAVLLAACASFDANKGDLATGRTTVRVLPVAAVTGGH